MKKEEKKKLEKIANIVPDKIKSVDCKCGFRFS